MACEMVNTWYVSLLLHVRVTRTLYDRACHFRTIHQFFCDGGNKRWAFYIALVVRLGLFYPSLSCLLRLYLHVSRFETAMLGILAADLPPRRYAIDSRPLIMLNLLCGHGGCYVMVLHRLLTSFQSDESVSHSPSTIHIANPGEDLCTLPNGTVNLIFTVKKEQDRKFHGIHAKMGRQAVSRLIHSCLWKVSLSP